MQRTRFYSATPNPAFVPASESRTYKAANSIFVVFIILAVLVIVVVAMRYWQSQSANVVKPAPTVQASPQAPVAIPVLPLPAIPALSAPQLQPEPTIMPDASKYPAGTQRDVNVGAPDGWIPMPDCKSQGLRTWVHSDPRTGDVASYYCAK